MSSKSYKSSIPSEVEREQRSARSQSYREYVLNDANDLFKAHASAPDGRESTAARRTPAPRHPHPRPPLAFPGPHLLARQLLCALTVDTVRLTDSPLSGDSRGDSPPARPGGAGGVMQGTAAGPNPPLSRREFSHAGASQGGLNA